MYTRQAFGPRLFVAACSAAALLSATACGNGNNADNTAANRGDQPAATTPAKDANGSRSAEQQRVNLTGCLQKGDSGSYILTEVNRPTAGSVPSGENPNGNKVEKEQLQAAQHAYRLSADNNNDLDKMIGAQVRVEGTVAQPSDLKASTADRSSDQSVGTSGSRDRDNANNGKTANNRDREKIDESNLAKVNVASIEKVSDGCEHGGRAARRGAKR